MSNSPTPAERSAVGRTLSILGAFNSHNRALTVSEISRRSGLPVATAYRIVKKLMSWGALERTEEGRYSIGLRLWEVATLAPCNSIVRRAAMPHMLQLHAQTGATVMIAVRDHLDGIWLDAVWSGPLCSKPAGVGNRFPLHATAAGKVLLAHAEPDVQDAIYSRALGTEPAAVRSAVNEVRLRGYTVSDHQMYEQYCGVAAPIWDSRGVVVASVCVATRSAVGTDLQRARPVLTAAEAISQQLGFARVATLERR